MVFKELTMSFGVQKLYNNINLVIPPKQKVGIVGSNGAGKTTLFKLILKQLEPDSGSIEYENQRIELLPQVIDADVFNKEMTVNDFIYSIRPIKKLNKDLEKSYQRLSENIDGKESLIITKNIEKINKKLEYWDHYQAEAIMLKIIAGMKLDNILNQKVSNLSGGQKSKVAFARILFSKPEIILLDEPTNHLDKDSKDFVVDYLKKYHGSVYIISHDNDFLNQVTNKTLYIDSISKSFMLVNGNYEKFKKIYNEQKLQTEKTIKYQEKEEKRLQELINKYKYVSGKRKKMAQDREKKLERLQTEKINLNSKRKNMNFKIAINKESSKTPLIVENLCFKYDKQNENDVLSNVSFNLTRGEKFLIVGCNGIGKSTLLKLIIKELIPDKGIIKIGYNTDIGYYAQEHELLNNDETIINNFKNSNIPEYQLRSILGSFLFQDDEINKKIKILSPGERSRVALAKLSLLGANLLLLDEPTNHLDKESQKIIAETFKDYLGTMLVVSHNPEFVDYLGIDKVLILPSGKQLYYNRDIVEFYEKINNQDI